MEKFNSKTNKDVEDDTSKGEGSQQACSSGVAEDRLKASVRQMPNRKFLSEHDTSVSFSDSDDVTELSFDELSESSVRRKGATGKRSRDSEDGETVEEGLPETKFSSARRGRGRPPTTGKYIGVGAARAAQQAARREELARAQREYEERAQREDLRRQQAAETSPSRQPRRISSPVKDAEECTSAELDVRLQAALAKIGNVGKVSKGLKGTCIRDLKDAVAEVNAVGQVLLSRNIDEETAKLRHENSRLSNQVAELRHEVDELRKELRDERRRGISDDRQDSTGDIKRLMAEMEARFLARLSAIEGIGLRPPLGASAVAAKTSSKKKPPPSEANKTDTTKGKTKAPKPQREAAPTANLKTSEGEWTTVGEKKKSKKAAKKASKTQKESAKKSVAQKAPTKLRAPKSSAVVITLQPAAQEKGINYAQVLRKAKDKIDLTALGISGMRLKLARTGARLLELPGATSGDKADALANKLKDVFAADEVRVSRPTKRADIRISGFDDSVGPMEIHEAVVRAGSSSPDSIKVGTIRRRGQNGTGLGSVVVNCPISVAQKLADGRRIYVGWVSVQAKLLPPRPTRCFKCFSDGHLAAQCTSEVDVSRKCFRCGVDGHKANHCSAAPHCALCAAAGKPAEHRVGGKSCSPPKPERKGAKAASHVAPAVVSTPTVRTTTEGVAMES